MSDKLSTKTIELIAELVNISLSDSEKEEFTKEMNQTLQYVNNLEELETTDIKPTYQTTGITNRFQEEKLGERSLTQDEALSNTTHKKKGYFKIKGMEYDK
jgi:aspartyl-tRNA(Asn)/glutamyl-tRNA(Gln) amidotransferase subunit C